ncbi:MAG TPA: hypothetical protein VLU47_01955, partial [Blastocatellia bacterium]|nr:hypothetical protein [Blastocatellia bacterium]
LDLQPGGAFRGGDASRVCKQQFAEPIADVLRQDPQMFKPCFVIDCDDRCETGNLAVNTRDVNFVNRDKAWRYRERVLPDLDPALRIAQCRFAA